MRERAERSKTRFTDLQVLLLIGCIRFGVHLLTNGQYGFHRDEFAVLDDARFLSWGFVAYPPLAPFLARISLEIFGISLVGLRFWTAFAQGISVVLTGLIVRDLGGGRRAQVAAAVAASIALMALIMGSMFQYIGLDYLWWVLAAYGVVRRIATGDTRWWLCVGTALGLGMLTKYTIAFFAAGAVAWEHTRHKWGLARRRAAWGTTWSLLAVGGAFTRRPCSRLPPSIRGCGIYRRSA